MSVPVKTTLPFTDTSVAAASEETVWATTNNVFDKLTVMLQSTQAGELVIQELDPNANVLETARLAVGVSSAVKIVVDCASDSIRVRFNNLAAATAATITGSVAGKLL